MEIIIDSKISSNSYMNNPLNTNALFKTKIVFFIENYFLIGSKILGFLFPNILKPSNLHE